MTAQPEPEQPGLSLETWVAESVRAAQSRSGEGEKWFNLAGQVARDPQYSAELQALARVLQSMLGGNLQSDLSTLPPELRALVEKYLG